jgi:hypothetical protein
MLSIPSLRAEMPLILEFFRTGRADVPRLRTVEMVVFLEASTCFGNLVRARRKKPRPTREKQACPRDRTICLIQREPRYCIILIQSFHVNVENKKKNPGRVKNTRLEPLSNFHAKRYRVHRQNSGRYS